MDYQDNGINSAQVREKLDRLKGSAFVKDINIDILKKRSKELGCSMNDIIMTCTSRMFKRFLVEEREDTKTKQIRVAFPFSLRPPPKTFEDIELLNKFAIVPLDLKLVDDVE